MTDFASGWPQANRAVENKNRLNNFFIDLNIGDWEKKKAADRKQLIFAKINI